MRVWTVFRFALLLPLMGSACVTEQVSSSSFYAPVQAALLDTKMGKIANTHYVKLTITNHQDRPMWYLVPERTDITLPERGTFTLAENSSADAVERSASGGTVIEVRLKGSGLRAFRLPARGKLTLARHGVETATNKPMPAILDIMEARDLHANGKPIEQLLGVAVLCGKEVTGVDTTDTTAKVLANSGATLITTLSAEEHRFWMPKIEK